MDVKKGVYENNKKMKIDTFKYEQEWRFCIWVAKIKIKVGRTTGKRFPVFDYTDNKIVAIDAYKK